MSGPCFKHVVILTPYPSQGAFLLSKELKIAKLEEIPMKIFLPNYMKM
jgi:hypothetical protein